MSKVSMYQMHSQWGRKIGLAELAPMATSLVGRKCEFYDGRQTVRGVIRRIVLPEFWPEDCAAMTEGIFEAHPWTRPKSLDGGRGINIQEGEDGSWAIVMDNGDVVVRIFDRSIARFFAGDYMGSWC